MLACTLKRLGDGLIRRMGVLYACYFASFNIKRKLINVPIIPVIVLKSKSPLIQNNYPVNVISNNLTIYLI